MLSAGCCRLRLKEWVARAPTSRLPVWKNPLANCSAAGRPTTRADGTRSPDLIDQPTALELALVSDRPSQIPIGEPTAPHSTPAPIPPTPLPIQ